MDMRRRAALLGCTHNESNGEMQSTHAAVGKVDDAILTDSLLDTRVTVKALKLPPAGGKIKPREMIRPGGNS